MTDRNDDTDDGSTDIFDPTAHSERDDNPALVREHADGSETLVFDGESDIAADLVRLSEERGESPEEYVREAVRMRLDANDDGRGNASETNSELDREDADTYDPRAAVTPREVDTVLAAWSEEEFEELNRLGASGEEGSLREGGDDPDRVLVSLSAERAEKAKYIAWGLDREPNEVLDELLFYAGLRYEKVFYPHPDFD
jgi:hypothetical protein